jgi:hypothetical protein
MATVGQRYVDGSEAGLKELLAFIKRSLSGDNQSVRKLVTSKPYAFIIYTRLLEGQIDRYTVKVGTGATLLLFTLTGPKGPTNRNVFMVDDGDGAWRVDAESGAVKRFTTNVHVSSPIVSQVFAYKIKGIGLGHH